MGIEIQEIPGRRLKGTLQISTVSFEDGGLHKSTTNTTSRR
jgi:hypothetical protein